MNKLVYVSINIILNKNEPQAHEPELELGAGRSG
jgi:hypothetical protein